MSAFEKIDKERRKSELVFASNEDCAEAIREYISRNMDRNLYLALLQDGSGLSPRRSIFKTLADLVLEGSKRPNNVRQLTRSMGIDLGKLAGVSSLVWFVHTSDEFSAKSHPGHLACALNVAVGIELGLPVLCFDEKGTETGVPLGDVQTSHLKNELANWQADRRAFTDEIVREGLVIDPDYCEPVLWSGRGGAVNCGDLDIPFDLVWRIRRIELWVNSFSPDQELPSDEYEVAIAELDACGKELNRLIGVEVVNKWARE